MKRFKAGDIVNSDCSYAPVIVREAVDDEYIEGNVRYLCEGFYDVHTGPEYKWFDRDDLVENTEFKKRSKKFKTNIYNLLDGI